jgi:hypothetical protein
MGAYDNNRILNKHRAFITSSFVMPLIVSPCLAIGDHND